MYSQMETDVILKYSLQKRNLLFAREPVFNFFEVKQYINIYKQVFPYCLLLFLSLQGSPGSHCLSVNQAQVSQAAPIPHNSMNMYGYQIASGEIKHSKF